MIMRTILVYCLHFHFCRRKCPCSGRRLDCSETFVDKKLERVCVFITYLSVCWSATMTALLLWCHSMSPCSSKGGIIASAIRHLWWHALSLFIRLCCIENTVNELEVVDCALELTFHRYSDIFSQSLTWPFWLREKSSCFF